MITWPGVGNRHPPLASGADRPHLGPHGTGRLGMGAGPSGFRPCRLSMANGERISMATESDWKVPDALQPRPEDHEYDLDRVLSAVVGLRAAVPADAFTAETLGTERSGNGVLIRGDGLVLTVGYLVA